VAILIAVIRLKTRLPVEWDSSWEAILNEADRPDTDVDAAIDDVALHMRDCVQWRSCDVTWYGMALDMLDAVGNLNLEI
jgi:hypothetical protein